MQIKRLKIENFLSIRKAEIDLAPVNLFVGDNAQGKSSIADALAFAFLGKVPQRGIMYKNRAHWLVTTGQHDMKVVAETDSGTYMGTRQGSGNAPFDEVLGAIAFNPQRVLELDAKARQAAFSTVFRHAGVADKIEEYLSKSNGFEPEVFDRCRGDLDQAQKWAVAERRTANRRATDLRAAKKAGPPSVLEIDGQMLDLSKLTMGQLDQRQFTRKQERDLLIHEYGKTAPTVEGLEDMRVACVQKLNELDERRMQAEIQDAQNRHGQAEQVYRREEKKVAQIKAMIERLKVEKAQLEHLTGKCPFCKQAVPSSAKTSLLNLAKNELDDMENKKLPKAEEREKQKAHEWNDRAKEIRKLRTDYEAAGGIRREMDETIATIDDQFRKAQEWPEKQDVIAELDEKLDRLETIRRAKQKYDEYMASHGDLEAQAEQCEERAAQMDMLDKLLKPEGELRKIANEAVEQAEFDRILTVAWGMDDLNISAEGEVTLGGRPIEMAADSEKYRAGVLLAELLSRTMGLGFLVLDGMEIMSRTTRNPIQSRLPEWMQHFKTIVMLATVPEKPEPSKASWMRKFWVEGGEVKQVAAVPQKA